MVPGEVEVVVRDLNHFFFVCSKLGRVGWNIDREKSNAVCWFVYCWKRSMIGGVFWGSWIYT